MAGQNEEWAIDFSDSFHEIGRMTDVNIEQCRIDVCTSSAKFFHRFRAGSGRRDAYQINGCSRKINTHRFIFPDLHRLPGKDALPNSMIAVSKNNVASEWRTQLCFCQQRV